MKILGIITNDSEAIPKTIGYKLYHNLATIEDQEEVLSRPEWAYRFARNISGADIKKCEEGACKESKWAYYFVLKVSGADIRKCEEAVCKDPKWAYEFARWIPGADRDKCLKATEK